MKKVIIGMAMVLVMVFVTMTAVASIGDGIVYGTNGYDVDQMVREWAEHEGLDDWLIENEVNGVLYGIGAVAKEDFETDYGKEWSIENFNECSKTDWEMSEIKTWCCGFIDGYAVYRTQAKSETKALAYKNGEELYCVDALFMVYSVYDINGELVY